MGESRRRKEQDPSYGKPRETPNQYQESGVSSEKRSAIILQILSFALQHRTPGVIYVEVSYSFPSLLSKRGEDILDEVSLSFEPLLSLVNQDKEDLREQWQEHCNKVGGYGEWEHFNEVPYPTPPSSELGYFGKMFALISDCDFTTHRVFHFIGNIEKCVMFPLSEISREFEKLIDLSPS